MRLLLFERLKDLMADNFKRSRIDVSELIDQVRNHALLDELGIIVLLAARRRETTLKVFHRADENGSVIGAPNRIYGTDRRRAAVTTRAG
jgi:hypothetical protein